jgi:hypothetical protein
MLPNVSAFGLCRRISCGKPILHQLINILECMNRRPCSIGQAGTERVQSLTRISHRLSTAAADPGMSSALRSVGLLDVPSSTSAGPSVVHLVSMPFCTASL